MGVVVIVDRDEGFVERIRAVLARESGLELEVVPSHTTVCDVAERKKAYVVVFGPSVPVDSALELGADLATRRPAISSVLITQHVTNELLRSALRSGLRDVLSAADQTYGEVARSVREAYDAAAARRSENGVQQSAAAVKPHASRVVTVVSTKGGVGKSVIATNLAVALAATKSRRVVLVDLDLQFGDDGIMLNLQPTHTIFDAAQAIDRLDVDMLNGLLLTHPSGALVLLAPVRPEDAEVVTAAKVGRILDLLRQTADVVIIDTPGALNETVLTAIDKSDLVLAVATMDMPSVKNTRIALQKLAQLGYRDGMVNVVVNRADSKVLMDISEVEDAIPGHITARIPSDRLVPRSVNKGVPIVVDMPKSPVARSLFDLAALVAGPEEAK